VKEIWRKKKGNSEKVEREGESEREGEKRGG